MRSLRHCCICTGVSKRWDRKEMQAHAFLARVRARHAEKCLDSAQCSRAAMGLLMARAAAFSIPTSISEQIESVVTTTGRRRVVLDGHRVSGVRNQLMCCATLSLAVIRRSFGLNPFWLRLLPKTACGARQCVGNAGELNLSAEGANACPACTRETKSICPKWKARVRARFPAALAIHTSIMPAAGSGTPADTRLIPHPQRTCGGLSTSRGCPAYIAAVAYAC